MPRPNLARENEHSRHNIDQPIQELGQYYLHLARIAIGGAARDGGQQEKRYRLNATHEAKLKR